MLLDYGNLHGFAPFFPVTKNLDVGNLSRQKFSGRCHRVLLAQDSIGGILRLDPPGKGAPRNAGVSGATACAGFLAGNFP